MGDRRERALAANEAAFRELNEMVERAAEVGGVRDKVVFLCECGDDLCAEEIEMTATEYETIRTEPTHFLIRPGHFRPEVEVVVQQDARYWVVEKIGEAADTARATDPRTEDEEPEAT